MADIHDLKNVLLSMIDLGAHDASAQSLMYRKLCDEIDEVCRIDGNPRSMARSAKFWAIFFLGSNIAPILRQWSLLVFACGRRHDADGSLSAGNDMRDIAFAIKQAADLAESRGV